MVSFAISSDGGSTDLNAEGNSAADVSCYQLIRHAPAHGFYEGCAGTMHGDHDVRFELLKLIDCMFDVIVFHCTQMEAPDYRV